MHREPHHANEQPPRSRQPNGHGERRGGANSRVSARTVELFSVVDRISCAVAEPRLDGGDNGTPEHRLLEPLVEQPTVEPRRLLDPLVKPPPLSPPRSPASRSHNLLPIACPAARVLRLPGGAAQRRMTSTSLAWPARRRRPPPPGAATRRCVLGGGPSQRCFPIAMRERGECVARKSSRITG